MTSLLTCNLFFAIQTFNFFVDQINHRAGQGEADLQQAQGRQQEAAGGPDLSAGDVRQDQHGACQDQGHRDQAQGGLRESHLRPGDVQRTVTHNFCIF